MGIDWFTFVAQVVNFLILIGLLWHFAYKPIIRAMDEREASIRERLDEAEARRAEAEEKARRLDEKHEEFEAKREELLAKAREQAEARRKELIAEARQRVGQNEAEWRGTLERRKQDLADELQRRAGRHLVGAARRLLRDLADADLEAEIVEVFGKRLGDLDDDSAQALRKALGENDGRVSIVSAFELGDPLREQLRTRLADLVEGEAEPSFETETSLLCGIELRVGEQRVAWSARDYLAELQDRLETVISAVAQRKPDEAASAGEAAAERSNGRGQGEDG